MHSVGPAQWCTIVWPRQHFRRMVGSLAGAMVQVKSLPTALILAIVVLGALGGSARADTRTYTYIVEHPTFGHIGTYTDTVEQFGGHTWLESRLHVVIRLLGFVVFRQDAVRSEEWSGGRLILFHGVTITNGKKLEVTGKAEGNTFVINSPAGTTRAPADVYPSNPWSAGMLNSKVLMSTRTGEIENIHITGGGETPVTFDGKTRLLHQYRIEGRKPGVIWLNDRNIPVAFRVWEHGTPVDFVLSTPPVSSTQTAMVPH